MLIRTNININRLNDEGKNYKWEKPKCSICFKYPYGHGFVSKILNFAKKSIIVYLKRYRCIRCKIVITLYPKDYCTRFQTSRLEIYCALLFRLINKRWGSNLRQRCGRWLRTFTGVFKSSAENDQVIFLKKYFKNSEYKNEQNSTI